MPGMMVYFGLLNTGQPKEGETVVVSGAAGAVVSVVSQIAQLKGCCVVAIADDVVNKLGFDACINYKCQPMRAAGHHVDVYLDKVGG